MKHLGLALLLVGAVPGWAQDDELEEAQGLPDEKPAEKPQTGWQLPEGWTERRYIWLEGLSRKAARGDWNKAQGPNAEASLTLNYKNETGFQAFLDGRAVHHTDPIANRGILEQLGIRYQTHEKILIALGKERSRRAPGLIVAPSDFLQAQENIPGQREQRSGIWQGRVAWQETARSLEVLALPFDKQNEQGMPDPDARWKGWALRGYHQFTNFDVQLSVGRLPDGWHEGLATQGIVGTWKIYAEAGWMDEARSQLAGVEYQGWDKWSVRGEYLHQDPLVSREPFVQLWRAAPSRGAGTLDFRPFLRENYAIASVSGLGLDDRWNLFTTLIRGADDRGYVSLIRGEWLMGDQQVLGLSILALSEGDTQQYAGRPFDRQVSLDWKFTL